SIPPPAKPQKYGMEYFWDARQELGADPPERTPAPEVERQSMRDRASSSLVRTFVPRGFAVVHSASPGTGYSQGCPTVGGSNEALAPKAVVDWLNGRAKGYTAAVGGEPVVADWCTGKVGMMGTSYNGTLPIAAASTGVEGLETIVPVAPNTSYYHYYRSNGLVRHPGGYMGEDIDVLYDFINSGDPERRGWCNENVRDAVLVANLDRKTGDMSEWWAARDYSKQLGNVKASVLMAHGFNDWNVMPGHSFRVREVVKSMGLPTTCYYHQGGHGGDPPKELLVRWMTRFLYGVENGVEDGPRAYIVREGDKRSEPTAYPEFPHPDAETVTLRPSGDGLAVGALGEAAGTGVQTLVDDASVTRADMAKAAKSEHRLLF
ncbi:MAG: CocE/NonD family hydrolase, partial [Planctomycetota bacterium]